MDTTGTTQEPARFTAALAGVSEALREVHKELLALARQEVETQEGKKLTAFEMFRRAVNDAVFAWLRPVSELIVDIDELVEAEPPANTREAGAVREEIEQVVFAPEGSPGDFAQRFHSQLERFPKLVVLEDELRRRLSALPRPGSVGEGDKQRWDERRQPR
jgi:hypothetical protein